MSHYRALAWLKGFTLKNACRRFLFRSRVEGLIISIFLAAAAAGLFRLFLYSFGFFQNQKPFGPILLDETFYLFNFTLFVMLFISASVSAYTSLFKSGEVPFLLTRGIEWHEIYFVKMFETLWFSSWSFLFITLPFMGAFALVKNLPLSPIPLLCIAFYLPFVFLTSMMGNLAALLTIWLLPTRQRRQTALIFIVLLLILLFVRIQPQVIREQGSISGILSGYLPQIAFAKHPLVPSTWATRGILSYHHMLLKTPMNGNPCLFYFLVLLSNALFFIIPSLSAAKRLYPLTYYRVVDLGEISAKKRRLFNSPQIQWYDHLPWPSRPAMAFLEKDLKTFFRDPSEWSQLIIFFGLLLMYFLNLKNLQFHILKDFWKNIVFVLNTIGTYIVLSSFSMRFIFPSLSLEGSKAWILGLSPIRFSSLLLEKFCLGTFLSAILTLPLVVLSGWMLDIAPLKLCFTTGLGFFVCVALTGLSVGMGAKFPNFKSNNPAEIISGAGGSLLLILHLTYLIALAVFLILNQNFPPLLFFTIGMGSLLIGMIPLWLGKHALERMEF